MIYSNTDTQNSICWHPEMKPEAGEIARKFLAGEHALLELASVRSSATVALNIFLESASDSEVYVATAPTGDMLVHASDTDERLVLTGKTAEVLRCYINEEPVMTQDRMEMTMRRRIA